MRKTLMVLMMVGLMTIGTFRMASAVTIYTNYGLWAAAGAHSTEDFNDFTLNPGLSFTAPVGVINPGGFFWDRPTASTAGATWTLPNAATAFGGNFDLAGPGGSGMGLLLTMSGVSTTFSAPEISSYNTGFWGFVSTDAFTAIAITAGSQGGIAETYHLDDMVYNPYETDPIPEPATVMLMGIGITGIIGVGARKKLKKKAANNS